MSIFSRLQSIRLFPVLVVALVLTEYGIAHTAAFAAHPDILALAVTLDLVIGIPALGYFFLVRPRRAPASILALLFLLSVLLANVILPASGERYLQWIEQALPVVEIALLLYGATKLRKVVYTYRILRPNSVYASDAVEQSLRNVLGNSRAIGILLIEFSLLYYAVAGWFSRYHPSLPSHRSFTYHVKSGYGITAAMIIGLSLIEIPLVHLVVHQFNPTVAWILTLLTLYTVLWLIGDFHAIRLHPIIVDATHLHFRTGMRWRVTIPLEEIITIHPLARAGRKNKEEPDLSVAGNARLLLELKHPVPVRGLFGIQRVTDKFAFALDDEKAFLEAVAT